MARFERPRDRFGHDEGLNPFLYQALSRLGEVEIAHEGEAMILGPPELHYDRGTLGPNIVWPGEYYKINCPYCNDTTKRLWVNHRYGTVDKETGVTFNWLAICYNERCLGEWENRADFDDKLFGFRNRDVRLKGQVDFRIKEGRIVDADLGVVALPGQCIPIGELPPHHVAVRYLTDRGYDVAALDRHYRVAFCRIADPAFPLARNRIIVPILRDGQMVGWQARYVGDIDFKAQGIPKYYTLPHFPRRLVLYNWDWARQERLVVVTEGVTDVWRVGEPGVALLGSAISRDQEILLSAWDREGAGLVVLLLDGEATEEADKIQAALERTLVQSHLARVILPRGRDPGGFDRDVLWRTIASQCRQQQIDLSDYR